MKTIGFLACETTLPGSATRREDAHEHDLMVAALEPALAEIGMRMRVIDWEAGADEFDDVSLALLGTAWNYQDKHSEFLARLEALEARGIALCNSSNVVRWNSRKTYLRELEEAGAAIVPTLWQQEASHAEIAEAFDHFGGDKLVVKRQVGAGAEGQILIERGNMPDPGWRYGHAAMIQPFLPSIQDEGEFSLIFIDGQFSHALRKYAPEGEYRIQSLYGGREEDYAPSADELDEAGRILAALPFDTPLYARIDMVRREDGALLLMEAELIEPYLYPEQGPELGRRMARAIGKRLV